MQVRVRVRALLRPRIATATAMAMAMLDPEHMRRPRRSGAGWLMPMRRST